MSKTRNLDDTTAVVSLTGNQTLTNKTLTAPTLNTPVVNNPTINNPTMVGVKEPKVAMAANNIDLSLGGSFSKTIVGNTTLTVSNVPANGFVAGFFLVLTNGGVGTITWWSGVKWAKGNAPLLSVSGRDRLMFITEDGGATWDGALVASNLS